MTEQGGLGINWGPDTESGSGSRDLDQNPQKFWEERIKPQRSKNPKHGEFIAQQLLQVQQRILFGEETPLSLTNQGITDEEFQLILQKEYEELGLGESQGATTPNVEKRGVKTTPIDQPAKGGRRDWEKIIEGYEQRFPEGDFENEEERLRRIREAMLEEYPESRDLFDGGIESLDVSEWEAVQQSLSEAGMLPEGVFGSERGGSLDLYKTESIRIIKEASLDPVGFVREHVLGIVNAGPARPDLLMSLRYASASPELSHSQGRILGVAAKFPGIGSGIKEAGELERAMGALGYTTPGELLALQEFDVPISIVLTSEDDANPQGFQVSLSAFDAMDLLNRDPVERRKMMSSNTRVRDQFEIDFPGRLINQVVGRRVTSDNFISADYSDVEERMAAQSVNKRRSFGLRPLKPKQIEKKAHLLDVMELEMGYGALKTWAGWTLKLGEGFFTGWGWLASIDATMTDGRYPYNYRAALRGDRYMEGYHLDLLWSRAYGDTLYRDLYGENWEKLSPWTGLGKIDLDSETASNLSLASRNVDLEIWGDPESESTKEALRLYEWVTTDAPLLPWLKPFEQLIFEGKQVEFDTYSPVELPPDWKKKNLKISDKGGRIKIDFSDTRTAREFIMSNRSSKGWVRTQDQMFEMASLLTEEEKLYFNGKNFGPVLEFMALRQKRQIDISGLQSRNFEGFLNTIKQYSLNYLVYENLQEYDLWKWWYYFLNSKASHGLLRKTFMAANIAAKPDQPTEGSVQNLEKQEEELINNTKSLAEGFAYAKGKQREEIMSSVLVGVLNNSSKHKSPHWRYKAKTSENSLLLIEYGRKGSSHPSLASDLSLGRVGLTPRQRSLGFRVEGLGNGALLIAMGGHVVYEGELVNDSFPAAEQFHSRQLTLGVFERLINEAGFDQGNLSGDTLKAFFRRVKDEKMLPGELDITNTEASIQNRRYLKI